MRRLLALVAVLGLCSITSAQNPAEEKTLPPNAAEKTVTVKKFTFTWHCDSVDLIGRVAYPTKGWVAAGFNPVKVMQGANIIMGCVTDKGETILSDQFGVEMYKHKPDDAIGGVNNITKGSVTEVDGVTTVSFTIPLKSGDARDVELTAGTEVTVIFSESSKDNITRRHDTVAKTRITL